MSGNIYRLKPSGKLTRLGKAIQKELENSQSPVITAYELFQKMAGLYQNKTKLMLRKDYPEIEDFNRLRLSLIEAKVLMQDKDFKDKVFRIIANGDSPAEEICCIADSFCYLSHISAMARYGLTDRRPISLHLTAPHPKTISHLIQKKMMLKENETPIFTIPIKRKFPIRVRNQSLSIVRSKNLGESQYISGTFTRIATIGQVFADTLDRPSFCGGMAHVLDVWTENARDFIDEIIDTVNKSPKKIIKVRAGYILEELIGLTDPRIQQWKKFAQRGSSQLLDPSKPYSNLYSAKWMLSLNAK